MEVAVTEGYRLVGLKSVDTANAIANLEFLFIDTNNVRCQVPSQPLIRNITSLFFLGDKDKDAYLQPAELFELGLPVPRAAFPDQDLTQNITLETF